MRVVTRDSENVRKNNQQDLLNNKFKIICATTPNGHSMPQSIEQFYQESGRGGCDGKIATSILYFDYADFVYLRKLIDGPLFFKQISRPIKRYAKDS